MHPYRSERKEPSPVVWEGNFEDHNEPPWTLREVLFLGVILTTLAVAVTVPIYATLP